MTFLIQSLIPPKIFTLPNLWRLISGLSNSQKKPHSYSQHISDYFAIQKGMCSRIILLSELHQIIKYFEHVNFICFIKLLKNSLGKSINLSYNRKFYFWFPLWVTDKTKYQKNNQISFDYNSSKKFLDLKVQIHLV